jgi:hypothetical protein
METRGSSLPVEARAYLSRAGLASWEQTDWGGKVFPFSSTNTVAARDHASLRLRLLRAVADLDYQVISEDVGFETPAVDISSLSGSCRLVAERPETKGLLRRLVSWLASSSAAFYDVFLGVFLVVLVAGFANLIPLPTGLLAVPVVLSGFALWTGFYTRAQRTDLIRVDYSMLSEVPKGQTTIDTGQRTYSDWRLTLSIAQGVSHNRGKAGFKAERWLDHLESLPTAGSVAKEFVDRIPPP